MRQRPFRGGENWGNGALLAVPGLGTGTRYLDAPSSREYAQIRPMPSISVSVAHDQSLDEAQRRLEAVVQEISRRFSFRRIDWSPDRRRVELEGLGARLDMWVDAHDIHVTGELPGLGALLGGPIASGLKQVLERTFRRPLP